MNRFKIILVSSIIIFASASAFAGGLPKIFPFKKKDALTEWEEKLFKGRVLYSVRIDRADGYLSAYSQKSASGIFYRMRFDPKQNPMVSWKWKVLSFPKKSAVAKEGGTWIERDDYAARFYIIFPKLAFTHTKSLEYVWDEKLPEGTIMDSPYFKNIKIVVIESGNANLNKWVQEKRNVCEDYIKAFGSKPGMAGAIAIMTDTDNTQSTAEAQYDEIKVGYKDDTK